LLFITIEREEQLINNCIEEANTVKIMTTAETANNDAPLSVGEDSGNKEKRSTTTKTKAGAAANLKKLWLITTGSRGDVQPYVAVAAALQKRGYSVKFLTSAEFVVFAQSFGITDAVAIRPSNDEMLSLSGGDDDGATVNLNHKVIDGMMNGDARTLLEGMADINEMSALMTCRVVEEELSKEGNRPDLILTTSFLRGLCWALAIKYGIPYVDLGAQALSYNPKWMHMGMPTLPFGLHYYLIWHVLHPFVYRMQLKFGEPPVSVDLQKHMPLRKYMEMARNPRLPYICLFSPELASVLHPRADPRIKFVGTTVLERRVQCTHLESFGGSDAMQSLDEFLKADNGRKPIYLGWGSMVSRSPEHMVELCVRSVHAAQQRAIVLSGEAKLSLDMLTPKTDCDGESSSLSVLEPEILEYAKRNILFVSQAPHEWLLPQVAATVHHGGAGTTTAALRAGVPTVITPVFVDQFDHSYLVRQLQVGVGFKQQLHKITWQQLAEAIRKVVSDPAMADRSARLGERLRAEDGASNAVQEIERFWEEYCVTGEFYEVFPGFESDEEKGRYSRGIGAIGRILGSENTVVYAAAVTVGIAAVSTAAILLRRERW